jgi:hypothetical protein
MQFIPVLLFGAFSGLDGGFPPDPGASRMRARDGIPSLGSALVPRTDLGSSRGPGDSGAASGTYRVFEGSARPGTVRLITQLPLPLGRS